MAETFHTRIPKLSDSELDVYLRNYSKYERAAVEIALAELRKRGRGISEEELLSIRAALRERDAGESGSEGDRDMPGRSGLPRIGRRQIRRIAATILALGLGSALGLYLTAGPAPADPLGYDPLNTKKYLRELEVYGGKANVLSVELQQWFFGLWHGRSLAATVAVLTVLLAFGFWVVATTRLPGGGGRFGVESNPNETS